MGRLAPLWSVLALVAAVAAAAFFDTTAPRSEDSAEHPASPEVRAAAADVPAPPPGRVPTKEVPAAAARMTLFQQQSRFRGVSSARRNHLRTGDAGLRVIVRDNEGLPVPSAYVFALTPEQARAPILHVGRADILGRTDEEGRLARGDLPAGRAVLFARPPTTWLQLGRLDSRLGYALEFFTGHTHDIELSIGDGIAEACRLDGRVVDQREQPVSHVAVRLDSEAVLTNGNGEFTFPLVRAGSYDVACKPQGWVGERRVVHVRPHKPNHVTMQIRIKEQGKASLSGVVKGPGGEAVAGARVRLTYIARAVHGSDRMVLRDMRTNDEGAFTMSGLPDYVRKWRHAIDIDHADFGSVSRKFLEGVPDAVELAFDRRKVAVRIALRDVRTGEPLTEARIDFLAANGARRKLKSVDTSGDHRLYVAEGGLSIVAHVEGFQVWEGEREIEHGGPVVWRIDMSPSKVKFEFREVRLDIRSPRNPETDLFFLTLVHRRTGETALHKRRVYVGKAPRLKLPCGPWRLLLESRDPKPEAMLRLRHAADFDLRYEEKPLTHVIVLRD